MDEESIEREVSFLKLFSTVTQFIQSDRRGEQQDAVIVSIAENDIFDRIKTGLQMIYGEIKESNWSNHRQMQPSSKVVIVRVEKEEVKEVTEQISNLLLHVGIVN